MSESEPRRCSCGYALQEWRYEAKGRVQGRWCAGLDDLLNHQQRKPTRHDVLSWGGRRVQRGGCQPRPDRGPHIAK